MMSFMRRWSAPFERREINGTLAESTITTPLLADDDDDDDDDESRVCESVQPQVCTAAEADDSDDDDDDDDEVFETGQRLELRPTLHH